MLMKAADALRRANKRVLQWTTLAAVCGLIFVAAGYYFFGVVGAMGGAVVAYSIARDIEHRAKRAKGIAETELSDAQKELDRCMKEPGIFSAAEKNDGPAGRGAMHDVRPNWKEEPTGESLTGKHRA